MMANLSERDRRTLRFGGIAAAAIVILMVVVFPAMDYWDRLNEKVTTANKKIAQITSDVTGAADADSKMKKLRAQVTLYPDQASLNRQTARMLEQIQRLPAYRELAITRVEGQPLRPDEMLVRSAVSIQFTGTLDHLHALCSQMEKAQPALKVERLTLATGRKALDKIEGQLVVSAFAAVTKGTSDERSSRTGSKV
jgi:Tfp pilus assembly protein PilO